MLRHFRELIASSVTRETLRASVVFGVLLIALVGIGGELIFRDLSLTVLRERTNVHRTVARSIAENVARFAMVDGVVDDSKLRQHRGRLENLIRGTMLESELIHYVEIRDRYGKRILFVARDEFEAIVSGPETPRRAGLTGGLPIHAADSVRVPLDRFGLAAQGETLPEGEVTLGISRSALEDELIELRRSLWMKIGVAGGISLGLLVLGLFYVLYLSRKNRNLERARQSAARASYVGLLASRLAHEIRNPLNAMNMNLQMLEEELQMQPECAGAEQFELLESTKSEVKRLANLVNNFLTYARPSEPRLESRDLNSIARDLVRLLEADFAQHGVRLIVDLEPLLPHVETDETQLRQAVINLLVNARQVLDNGGMVTLRTRAGSKGEVVIEVEDNGPGVPPEVRDRIFEVFYSSRGGGTGLGLPIARQIVERHGGKIEVDSFVGRGTTFRIRLPRAQRVVEPEPTQ